jgi:hypothetical protein
MADFDPDAWLNKQRERDQERANLQQQLGTGITPPAQSTFNPDEYLTRPMPVPEAQPVPPEPAVGQGLQPGVLAPAFYYPGQTGLGTMASDLYQGARASAGPAVQGFQSLAERYMSKPGKPLEIGRAHV